MVCDRHQCWCLGHCPTFKLKCTRAISHLLPSVVLLSSARIDLYVTYKKSKALIQNLKFLYFKFIFFYHLSKNRGNCPILTKDSITSAGLTGLLSELTHHHETCNKCVEYQGPNITPIRYFKTPLADNVSITFRTYVWKCVVDRDGQ